MKTSCFILRLTMTVIPDYLKSSRMIFILSFFVSFACILAFQFYVKPGLNPASGRNSMIELQLAFDKNEALIIIDTWGDSGKKHFLDSIWIDFLFPAGYSTFLSSLIARSLIRIKSLRFKSLIFIPFAAALLDIIENTIEIFFVMDPSLISENLFILHSIIASVKWILAVSTLIFLAVTGIYFVNISSRLYI